MRRRERLILSLSIIVVLLMSYYLFLISPAKKKMAYLERRIELRKRDLEEMKRLKARWDQYLLDQQQIEKMISSRGKGFTILSFLEKLSREIGLHERLRYMKPINYSQPAVSEFKRTGMEIKLESLDTEELVKLLYNIEYSGKILNIRRIKIQTFEKRDQRLMKVIMDIDTFIGQGG